MPKEPKAEKRAKPLGGRDLRMGPGQKRRPFPRLGKIRRVTRNQPPKGEPGFHVTKVLRPRAVLPKPLNGAKWSR